MSRTPIKQVAFAFLGLALSAGAAQAFTVDGNLSDWGVSVVDNNGSDFVVSSDPSILGVHVEDQNDTAGNGGFLGPNSGGQNYDAEFMAVAYSGGKLHIAISTGQRPDNGFSYYSPGDIRIRTNDGTVFGIEVGGGAGGGAGGAITEGAAGSHYTTNSSGYTTAHTALTGAGAQLAGTIWSGATWYADIVGAPFHEVQFLKNASSVFEGTADYIYTRNSVTSQHAVIEMSFDWSIIADNAGIDTSILHIMWGPACGNDILEVTLATGFIEEIPEPGTLGVALFGLAGLAWMRRRRAA